MQETIGMDKIICEENLGYFSEKSIIVFTSQISLQNFSDFSVYKSSQMWFSSWFREQLRYRGLLKVAWWLLSHVEPRVTDLFCNNNNIIKRAIYEAHNHTHEGGDMDIVRRTEWKKTTKNQLDRQLVKDKHRKQKEESVFTFYGTYCIAKRVQTTAIQWFKLQIIWTRTNPVLTVGLYTRGLTQLISKTSASSAYKNLCAA